MRLSRRHLLAAAATVAVSGCGRTREADAAARPQTFYITPNGEGDGSAWEAAASIADIGTLIARVRPGGEILLAANHGEYTLPNELVIDAGGAEGAAVYVHGVNSETGAATPAIVRGNRTADEPGMEAFRLRGDANHLRFSHFDFRDIGDGCFRVGGSITNLTIEDCAFENVYRFLENTVTGDARAANLRRFAVRRCEGTRVERAFSRLRYESSDGVFEDCRAHGRANQGGDIPVGCALEDSASNIVYRRCVMEGFQQLNAGHYWNGDGFSDEAENANIRYEACEARGSTDGGFDCKSRDVTLVDCISEDNKRNFRVWSERATLTNCTSRAPNFRGARVESADSCHVWIGGEEPSVVRFNAFTVTDRNSTELFAFENDRARVELHGITLNTPHPNWGDARNRRADGDTLIVTPKLT